ncbi:MAG: hypothetical protein J6L86_08280 [Alphaproteobacteria bacterium]|nr:hypothetical protein [Alphaproteobacteria bacterium]MBQ8631748.1 hypothetical protein [Alphaproteobacteria bacterium]
MKKLAFLTLLAFLFVKPAHSTSLDEIYRDLVKSDNEGYLPLYVKNRKIPDVLIEDGITEIPLAIKAEDPKITPYQIPLVDKYKIEEEARIARQRKWENAVLAVKENRVTPVELDEILLRVAENNPHAVEIYAWMNARGIGIPQDLVHAFNLYQQAIFLKVAGAEKNAAAVYKVMKPEQRQQIKAYIPPEEDEEEK